MIKKVTLSIVGLVIGYILFPVTALAGLVEITPAVINFKGLPRDIYRDTITVTNTSGRRLDLYAIVNNVDIEEGKVEFENLYGNDVADSLANWIKISRAVIELEVDETVEIPIEISVNMRAQPDVYYAAVVFSSGFTRAEAERMQRSGEQLLINIEVIENVVEKLQLGSFGTGKRFFSGPDIAFNFDLENIGNREVQPEGEVRIYDRRNREVAAIPANELAVDIGTDNTAQLGAVWSAGKAFGRYKAYLDIGYGKNQQGTINDTIYFWVIPWQKILAIFVIMALLVGVATYMWYTRLERRRQLAYSSVLQNQPLYTEREYPSGEHVMDMRDMA